MGPGKPRGSLSRAKSEQPSKGGKKVRGYIVGREIDIKLNYACPRFHPAGYMPRHAAHDGYRTLAVHSGERLVQRLG